MREVIITEESGNEIKGWFHGFLNGVEAIGNITVTNPFGFG